MQVKLRGSYDQGQIRDHPYDGAETDPAARFYNFRENPELIRCVLEDFKPYEKYPTVDYFYQLLEWINGPESIFESTDCRLRIRKRDIPSVDPPFYLQGRLMVIFRNMKANLSVDVSEWLIGRGEDKETPLYPPSPYIEWLGNHSEKFISEYQQEKWWLLFDIFYFPAFFIDLPSVEASNFGYQIVYEFSANGHSEEDLFLDFGTISNTLGAMLMDAEQGWFKLGECRI